ncbi:hypothetical protein XENTR_v10015743 [Xenopus tropicalis]|nr:hypothetical protein XENTR_v10015743 [Xenopus tropicalis]
MQVAGNNGAVSHRPCLPPGAQSLCEQREYEATLLSVAQHGVRQGHGARCFCALCPWRVVTTTTIAKNWRFLCTGLWLYFIAMYKSSGQNQGKAAPYLPPPPSHTSTLWNYSHKGHTVA